MELDENRLIAGVSVWTAEDFLKYAKGCKICPSPNFNHHQCHIVFQLSAFLEALQ
jgi:hypothetical protein